MRTLPPGTWDMILCLGNSLALLPDRGEVQAVFSQIHSRLHPKGIMLLQLLNFKREGMDKPRIRVENACIDEVSVTAVKSFVPENGKTLLTLSFYPDTCYAPLAECVVLHHYTLSELEDILQETGLYIQALWGDFQEKPFQKDSSTDLILCIKKNI